MPAQTKHGEQSKKSWLRFNAATALVPAQSSRFMYEPIRLTTSLISLNVLLFGCFFAVATPMYETNDDLMLQSIASGFYTNVPDDHIIFTNIIIGKMLALLYTHVSGVNWYIAYLISVHVAAMTAIAFVVISRSRRPLFVALYIAFFMLVEVRILLHLQFTTTAFVAGSAGLLLLIDGITCGTRICWRRVVAGLVFLCVMCLIREQVAMLFAIVSAPFTVERIGVRHWRRLLAVAIGCATIFLAFHAIDQAAYRRDAAWTQFSEYNSMRGEIHITPLAEFISQAAPAVGWSANDGQMFSEFYFADADVYAGSARMKQFLQELKARQRAAASPSTPQIGQFIRIVFAGDSGVLMNLAILTSLLCIACAGTLRRRVTITVLTYFALTLMVEYYLFYNARLPERVAYNFPLFVTIMCLYWSAAIAAPVNNSLWVTLKQAKLKLSSPARAASWRFASGVALVLCGVSYIFNIALMANRHFEANATHAQMKKTAATYFEVMRPLGHDGRRPLIIPLPTYATLEQSLFFHPQADDLPVAIVPYGFVTHSPIFEQIMVRYALKPYSLTVATRPDTYFMMEARWIKPLRIFYREHYSVDLTFEMVLNTDHMLHHQQDHIYLYKAAVG